MKHIPVVSVQQALLADNLIQDSLYDVIRFVGFQLANEFCKLFLPNSVLIAVGPGNNGNDGLALGIELLRRGYNVFFIDLYPNESNLIRSKLKSLISSDNFLSGINFNLSCFDFTFVDAIFGLKQRFPLDQKVIDVLRLANSCKTKIAIDVPTGINPDSGEVGEKISWDYTFCIQAIKQGLCFGEASVLSGQKMVVDCKIKIPEYEYIYESLDLFRVERNRASHKYFYGPVGLIAGSKNMPGASKIAALGALCSGVSFIHLFSQSEAAWVKEAIFIKIKEFSLSELKNKISHKIKSLVFGPGVENFKSDIFILLKSLGSPCVIDAGGLKNLIELNENFVLTPHVGELNALEPQSYKSIFEKLLDVRKKYKACILVKSNSYIYKGRERNFILEVNNSKLSFGGVGDFLSGLIGGFLAQGLNIDDAVLLAVKLLSKSGQQSAWNLDSLIDKCRENIKYVLYQ